MGVEECMVSPKGVAVNEVSYEWKLATAQPLSRKKLAKCTLIATLLPKILDRHWHQCDVWQTENG